MRYLGIDYGSKRTGIAVSDEEGRIAFPQETLEAQVRQKIKKIVKEKSIGYIVVGLPRMPDGRETEETSEVRAFVLSLKKAVDLPVTFEDELLTTRIVASEGMQKNRKDESAAALILQSYLDKKNQESRIKN